MNTSIENMFVYTELTKKKVSEQVTLAVACSVPPTTGLTLLGRVYVVQLSYG